MPTELDARAVYEEVRGLFKNSLKSGNKRYSDAYGSAPQEKKDRRNRNYLVAASPIAAARKGIMPSASVVLKMVPERRAGNCDEYTAVAIRIAARREMQGIWDVGSMRGAPAAHTACVVGLPSHGPALSSWAAMQSDQNGTEDAWVIDGWAGILCPYRQYPIELRRQMLKWQNEGKEVYSGSGEVFMSGTEFGERLLRSRMEFLLVSAAPRVAPKGGRGRNCAIL